MWAAFGAVIIGAAMVALTLPRGVIHDGAAQPAQTVLAIKGEDTGKAVTVNEGDWIRP